MKRSTMLAVLVIVAAAVAGFAILRMAQARTPLAQITRQIKLEIERKDVVLRSTTRLEATRTWRQVRAFYAKRRHRPAWTDGGGPRPQAAAFAQVVARAGMDGLDPADYDLDALKEALERAERRPLAEPPPARALADLDVRFTYTYFRYATHLRHGRIARRQLDPDWVRGAREADLSAGLARVARGEGPEKLLAELSPRDRRYHRLRQAWADHARIVEAGGWPRVPGRSPLRLGHSGERVHALARRLAVTGDLRDSSGVTVYDRRVERAVQTFQGRHGLPVTGVADAATLAALNVPAGARLRQIQLNLERWRWLPPDLGRRHIAVNIPDYRLDLVDAGRVLLHMAVVVGKRMSPTPVFSDRAVSVELHPYWNVPAGIARDEILPVALEDPGYLSRNGMRLLSAGGEGEIDPESIDWSDSSGPSGFRLRQDPGPQNPLGRIKIVLPNEYDIYLHDTPAGHLFDQKERDFSHGCIRVERPLELAAYLLRGHGRSSSAEIEEILASGENRSLPIPDPIPVHILYFTAWAEENGTVQFREDVYGHDARMDAALRRGRMSSFRVNAAV